MSLPYPFREKSLSLAVDDAVDKTLPRSGKRLTRITVEFVAGHPMYGTGRRVDSVKVLTKARLQEGRIRHLDIRGGAVVDAGIDGNLLDAVDVIDVVIAVFLCEQLARDDAARDGNLLIGDGIVIVTVLVGCDGSRTDVVRTCCRR